MSLAIVPGSFDPMTLGHLELIGIAARRYDEVVVAVMQNAEKNYLFTTEERVEIARRTVAALPNVRVISDDGMLIDLFDRLGATAVCKGVRNETDLAYETYMANWNQEHNPRFVTELIPSEGCYANVSSTDVRNAMKNREELSALVHPDVISILSRKNF
ncbi:MAG: pantetheine-phosphate adenylyltransferase [Ruminococcaceae bacterium]|nr:pantetheine-phosphate adenylyltransferase [Oscillospiraceae bacterium]